VFRREWNPAQSLGPSLGRKKIEKKVKNLCTSANCPYLPLEKKTKRMLATSNEKLEKKHLTPDCKTHTNIFKV
jgi:hypothetical protein